MIFASLLASLGAFLFGLDIGYIAPILECWSFKRDVAQLPDWEALQIENGREVVERPTGSRMGVSPNGDPFLDGFKRNPKSNHLAREVSHKTLFWVCLKRRGDMGNKPWQKWCLEAMCKANWLHASTMPSAPCTVFLFLGKQPSPRSTSCSCLDLPIGQSINWGDYGTGKFEATGPSMRPTSSISPKCGAQTERNEAIPLGHARWWLFPPGFMGPRVRPKPFPHRSVPQTGCLF